MDGHGVDALLDTASTLSFLSADFVERAGLPTRRAKKLATVRVANGQRMTSHRTVVTPETHPWTTNDEDMRHRESVTGA